MSVQYGPFRGSAVRRARYDHLRAEGRSSVASYFGALIWRVADRDWWLPTLVGALGVGMLLLYAPAILRVETLEGEHSSVDTFSGAIWQVQATLAALFFTLFVFAIEVVRREPVGGLPVPLFEFLRSSGMFRLFEFGLAVLIVDGFALVGFGASGFTTWRMFVAGFLTLFTVIATAIIARRTVRLMA